MPFAVIPRIPRQPCDGSRSMQFLDGLLAAYENWRQQSGVDILLENIDKSFATGCYLWPAIESLLVPTGSNHLPVFEWLDSYLRRNPDCKEVVFMLNLAVGFHCYVAVYVGDEYEIANHRQWLICWRQDELFGHSDLVAVKYAIKLFMINEQRFKDEAMTTKTRHPSVKVYKTAIDLCKDCIFLCNADGAVSEVNKSAADTFGDDIGPQRLLTCKKLTWLATIIHPDDLASVAADWNNLLSSNTKEGMSLERGDCRMISVCGKTAHYHIKIIPVFDSNSSLTSWILLAQDAARVELERRQSTIEDSRARFLAEMSHEIRTPLSCIIGTTDLIKYTNLGREQQELVTTISTCSRQLFQLIENILDFSKIQEKKQLLNPTHVVLERVIYEAVQFVSPEIHRKDLDFFLNIDPDTPECILIDELRLRQILTNLIGNAVKFTENQTMVSIRVKRESCASIIEPHRACPKDTIKLRFEIEDRGPGLAEGENSTLFESYVQLNETIQSKFGGTGLGLAISKKLVTMMGGRVWFESIPGHGSTFIFTIQTCKIDCVQDDDPGVLTWVRASRILNEYMKSFILKKRRHVTINVFTRSFDLKAYLQSIFGHFQGLEVADSNVINEHEMCIVIADDSMKMEHLQSLIIKSQPFIIGIIYMTRDVVSTVQALLEHNVQAKTIKRPINVAQLVKTTFELLVESQMAESIGSSNISVIRSGDQATGVDDGNQLYEAWHKIAANYPLNIMIVDDNSINIQLMLRVLKKFGYQFIQTAENGRQAVDLFKSMNGGERPIQCIFMDMEMPELDGCGATLTIRSLEAKERQPHIIALTANAFHGDQDKCLWAGMCRYLCKPVKWESLELELEFAYKAIHGIASCCCKASI